ncbi:MAG: hypothetical protein ACR2PQ_13125 [Myxococcota bacterium]
MSAGDADLLVSIHVPKTGGITFREILEDLAEGHVAHDYDDRPLAPASPWKRLRQRLRRPTLPPGTRVVHGHFVATKYWKRYPDARYLAWFREPVERLASHYYYWQREPDLENATCRRLLDEKLSLVEFASIPEMRNVHSRFLGAVPVEALAFVGITEAYDASLELFRRDFCPERPVAASERNTNPDRAGAHSELEPADREAVAALNRPDLELYEQALARHRKLLGSH